VALVVCGLIFDWFVTDFWFISSGVVGFGETCRVCEMKGE
jgi:hypothetical protein